MNSKQVRIHFHLIHFEADAKFFYTNKKINKKNTYLVCLEFKKKSGGP